MLDSTNQGTPRDPVVDHAGNVRIGEPGYPSPATQCQLGSHLTLPPDNNDALFRSVVDTWISDHQISASSHIESHRDAAVATNAGSSSHEGRISAAVASVHAREKQDNPDHYAAILIQTARLEQALAWTTSPTPIDFVLEAERDFNAVHHRLITCTGHVRHLSPTADDYQSSFPPQAPTCNVACLVSGRPVLLGLTLLAERVVGMLEDMFRLAARAAQSIDKASDFVWAGTLGTSSSSARRIHRSLRNVMARPCAMVDMESYRPLRVDDFDVQGQAKSDAMGRILKLRTRDF
ncbi:hypothetical protein GGR58DRAFT_373629 [Xylaria digitata]|nr:hypothetical protein GGR58DRAFT_373629 [Xylaria digitata]